MDNWLWSLFTGFDRSIQAEISAFVRRPMVLVCAVIAFGYAAAVRRLDALVVTVLAWPITVAVVYGLQEVLPRPYLGNHGGFPVNSFPSTHVALAATPLIAVLVLHHRRDLLSRLCVTGIAVSMFGNLMLLVHRPSDTIGSVALGAAVVAALQFVVLGVCPRLDRMTHT